MNIINVWDYQIYEAVSSFQEYYNHHLGFSHILFIHSFEYSVRAQVIRYPLTYATIPSGIWTRVMAGYKVWKYI